MTEIGRETCLVTWQPVKSMGRDRLEYSLQLQRLYGKDGSKADEYREVRVCRLRRKRPDVIVRLCSRVM